MAFFNVPDTGFNSIYVDGKDRFDKPTVLTRQSSAWVNDMSGFPSNGIYIEGSKSLGNVLYIPTIVMIDANIYDSHLLCIDKVNPFPAGPNLPVFSGMIDLDYPGEKDYSNPYSQYDPYGGFIVIHDDHLYLCSGNSNMKFYKFNWIDYASRTFPDQAYGSWISLPDCPLSDNNKVTAISYDGKIHIIQPDYVNGTILHYAFDGSEWYESFNLNIEPIPSSNYDILNIDEIFCIVDLYNASAYIFDQEDPLPPPIGSPDYFPYLYREIGLTKRISGQDLSPSKVFSKDNNLYCIYYLSNYVYVGIVDLDTGEITLLDAPFSLPNDYELKDAVNYYDNIYLISSHLNQYGETSIDIYETYYKLS